MEVFNGGCRTLAMNVLAFSTIRLANAVTVIHRHDVDTSQFNALGFRIFKYVKTFSRQARWQNRQGVPNSDATTFCFPGVLNSLHRFITTVYGFMIRNPGAFNIEVQHVKIQVVYDIVIMLLQVIHILTRRCQWGVIRSANGNHDVATCFTQRFNFAVLSVVVNVICGTPCRQAGISIFTDHESHGEVGDILVLRKACQIRL